MSEFNLKGFVAGLTQRAGVYRMYSDDNTLLYVGKAKNLKNRVSSYFRARGLNAKTVALVARIHHIDITVTGSEVEALLLEQTLIKQHKPPYNILLKDGKSYPYLHLSQHDFPQLMYRRVRKKGQGRYFGPYPNGAAVREALGLMQRIFQLRSCEDSYFNHRSRPCLQYEIKRCSAPCVDRISAADYQRDVELASLFLRGENRELIQQLQQQMLVASEELQFEQAALLRDRIELIRQIQEQQVIDGDDADADVWAILDWQGIVCIHRLVFRQGRLQHSENHFPENSVGLSEAQFLADFMAQFYLGGHGLGGIPKLLVADAAEDDLHPLQAALALQHNTSIKLSTGGRGKARLWRQMAEDNARAGAQNQLSGRQAARLKLTKVAELLSLPTPPNRIECFDISHAQGESTYASCVVYGAEGLEKSRYRRFSIKGVTAGDDYAALEQAVTRHLKRQIEQSDVPDLLLIDGGKGQIARIQDVLNDLGLTAVHAYGISKGETRKSGWEFLWRAGQSRPLMPDSHHEGFRLLQWVRDEAHRFAITGHRKARAKVRSQSDLDSLTGVGPKRRRDLLLHFGSLKNMRSASREEFERIPGISKQLATTIFAQLHGEHHE